MIPLREPVLIRCGWGEQELKGELFVGSDGFPELRITTHGYHLHDIYRPATLPAAWTIRAPNGSLSCVLLEAWNAIDYLRNRIACAQCEAEEVQRELDDIDAYKRDADAGGAR